MKYPLIIGAIIGIFMGISIDCAHSIFKLEKSIDNLLRNSATIENNLDAIIEKQRFCEYGVD